ncbi:hypothetical protein HELRODRAFT_188412 [Helobdella robusta]|uniref:Translation initiation factor eIF2B subunit beta n=1 Tax=Helobdella robusta TaxID=6412 RepID=T1FPY8_HELRO|nr:hypothetical protein HELRODRAFT_188412 [Helobdella robusta]ESO06598.1 hypothetical protein HELRODRAFT_188412 [Helobdella robusta]
MACASESDSDFDEVKNPRVRKFIEDLKFFNVIGSYNLATQTCALLKELISEEPWSTTDDIKSNLKEISVQIAEAFPKETCFTHVFNRFFKLFHDEISKGIKDLKLNTLEIVQEMTDDIEASRDNIAKHALEIIRPLEMIMTMGRSKTVEMFLKAAAKERDFHVMVLESSASKKQGREMAAALASHDIPTTLIKDGSMHAIMSTVTKVIVGAHTITSNGGIKGLIMSLSLAQVASFENKPFIVVAPSFKLSEKHFLCFDQIQSNIFLSPYETLPADDPLWRLNPKIINNHVFDFVPPEFITLIMTNLGPSIPSQLYRLVNEVYNHDSTDVSVAKMK